MKVYQFSLEKTSTATGKGNWCLIGKGLSDIGEEIDAVELQHKALEWRWMYLIDTTIKLLMR